MNYLKILLSGILFIATFNLKATVTLPAVFSDHMVIQRNSEVKFWGWAKPNEKINIQCSWDSAAVYEVEADRYSNWEVKVNTPEAGGPYTIRIKGYNEIMIDDVLVGEVWICSGQSNMEWSMSGEVVHGEGEIVAANNPNIRLMTIPTRSADLPQQDFDAEWKVCDSNTVRPFSAVGYFFAKQVEYELNVPIGMICSAWGGTPAEIWMDAAVVEKDTILRRQAQMLQEQPWGPHEPGLAYNAMIYPLMPYKIAGALWYQGESNTANAYTYSHLLSSLIQNWRDGWGYDFPFYYVQIAPYNYGENENGVVIRHEQSKVEKMVPNTGMVVISDIGNIEDIHPRNKMEVGKRLADWALNQTYGRTTIDYGSPTYKTHSIDGRKVRVYFDHVGDGLWSKDEKELDDFELAGADKVYYPAKAKIEYNHVILTCKEVKEPMYIRFAWENTAEPDLYNGSGVPVSAFKTDPDIFN